MVLRLLTTITRWRTPVLAALCVASWHANAWLSISAFWQQGGTCSQKLRLAATAFTLGNYYSASGSFPYVSTTMTNTAGNLLVVGVIQAGGSGGIDSAYPNAIFSVTDSKGNTYHPGPYVTNSGISSIQLFFATNIAGGSNTITAQGTTLTPIYNNGNVGLQLFPIEYSGVATTNAVDIATTALASSATYLIQPGAMTTTFNCDLVVGAFGDNAYAGWPTSGLGWVRREASDSYPAILVDNLTPGGATGGTVNPIMYGATPSFPSNSWSATQIAFRNSSTAANPQPTKIAFSTTAQTLATDTCSSALTIQSQNAGSTPTITSNGIPLTFSGTGVTFYVDSACQWPVTSGVIGAGTSTSTYYFTASDNASLLSVAAAGFTTINQSMTLSGTNSYVWKGGGGACDGKWSTGACWTGSAVPNATQTAHFDATCTTTNCVPTISAPVSVGGIWIHSDYAQSISLGANLTVANVFQQDGGTFSAGANTVTAGSLLLNGGTFNANSSTINLTGGWLNQGTFNSGTSTVAFTGVGHIFVGATTFYNLSITGPNAGWPGVDVVFPASTTQTISHQLTLTGFSGGGTISMRSSIVGTQFTINATGTASTTYLYLKDSKAQTAITITGPAGSSTNAGDDTGWTFP